MVVTREKGKKAGGSKKLSKAEKRFLEDKARKAMHVAARKAVNKTFDLEEDWTPSSDQDLGWVGPQANHHLGVTKVVAKAAKEVEQAPAPKPEPTPAPVVPKTPAPAPQEEEEAPAPAPAPEEPADNNDSDDNDDNENKKNEHKKKTTTGIMETGVAVEATWWKRLSCFVYTGTVKCASFFILTCVLLGLLAVVSLLSYEGPSIMWFITVGQHFLGLCLYLYEMFWSVFWQWFWSVFWQYFHY